jgi:mono/diheme cytochrome c family protein
MVLSNKLFYKANKLILLFALLFIFVQDYSFSQSQGQSIFTKTCQACHTIGKGRLVGPDLMDVGNRRSEEWIITFIKSSQSMVNNGDPDAVAIFNEYNKTVMPDQNLSESDIKDLLQFISEQSLAGGFSAAILEPITHSSGMSLEDAGSNEFTIGQKLFLGEEALTEGGPACIACHTVVNDEIISGGLLAVDLTTVFTRLSGAGINAVISNPPFPVMKTAYANHQITEDEAFHIIAFLKEADFISPIQEADTYQQSFLLQGIIGGIILFGLYGALWCKRKRKAVNHKIFARQLKTH